MAASAVPSSPPGPDDADPPADGRLRQVLGRVAVVRGTVLGGGLYNSARLLELDDGRRLVLKTAPPADAPALTHERGLLGTEALFHRLAAGAGARVPAVLHHEPAGPGVPSEWLLLSYLDGTTWADARERLTPADHAVLRGRLGATLARVASVTGPAYGYPLRGPGLSAADWPSAFTAMLRAVLADATRFGVALPAPVESLAELPVRFGHRLAEVRRPALVHFDAWEGNIVLGRTPTGVGEDSDQAPNGVREDSGPAPHGAREDSGRAPDTGTRRPIGLIDGERAFFGDPLAELVGLDPLGAAEDDAGLLAGYRSVDPGLAVDDGVRVRLALYRVYLALVMRVESVPRAYGGEFAAWLDTWSAGRLTEQLAVLDALER
ncbi:phosphotransferase family protein [Streptomyces zaomyceticus]|uniref:phosphotransferase family protein n=1 Tax=Streptomyces zaomyceticus TaxID=68286 RepID=UPI00370F929B